MKKAQAIQSFFKTHGYPPRISYTEGREQEKHLAKWLENMKRIASGKKGEGSVLYPSVAALLADTLGADWFKISTKQEAAQDREEACLEKFEAFKAFVLQHRRLPVITRKPGREEECRLARWWSTMKKADQSADKRCKPRPTCLTRRSRPNTGYFLDLECWLPSKMDLPRQAPRGYWGGRHGLSWTTLNVIIPVPFPTRMYAFPAESIFAWNLPSPNVLLSSVYCDDGRALNLTKNSTVHEEANVDVGTEVVQ